MRKFKLKKILTPLKETHPRKITPPLLIDFNVDDIVKVCSNELTVKEFQNCKECGGYSDKRMKCILGQFVKVKHISTNCVKVEWGNCEFDLHPNLIEIIDQKLATEDTHDRTDELFEAIEQGNYFQFTDILDKRFLNIKNNHGRTPINVACLKGHLEIVEKLLEHNVDLYIRDNDENLPIHNCAKMNYIDILQKMLSTDEDQLNQVDKDGRTLLHISIIQNNYDITKYLIEKEIKINIKDNFEKTASCYITDDTDLCIRRLMTESSLFWLLDNSVSGNSIFNPQSSIGRNNDQKGIVISLMEPPTDTSGFFTIKPNSSIVPEEIVYQKVNRNSILETLNETIPNENECKICMDRIKKVAFVDCGHMACIECANKLFHCHLCNKEIIGTLEIFL